MKLPWPRLSKRFQRCWPMVRPMKKPSSTICGTSRWAFKPSHRVVGGIQAPGHGLGQAQGAFLARRQSAQTFQSPSKRQHIVFHQALGLRFERALVAAVIAVHSLRHVEPAQLLEGVVAHAVAQRCRSRRWQKTKTPRAHGRVWRGFQAGARPRAQRARIRPAWVRRGDGLGRHIGQALGGGWLMGLLLQKKEFKDFGGPARR